MALALYLSVSDNSSKQGKEKSGDYFRINSGDDDICTNQRGLVTTHFLIVFLTFILFNFYTDGSVETFSCNTKTKLIIYL